MLRQDPQAARLLAGGSKLLASELPEVTQVVDVANLGLGGIAARSRTLTMGAATPVQDLLESAEVSAWTRGILGEACLAATSSLLLRNRSTLGGEIAGAGVQAPIVAALLVLKASLSVYTGSKSKIDLADYLSARADGSLGPHIVTAVAVPKLDRRLDTRLQRLTQLASGPSLALIVVALESRRAGCGQPRIAVTAATLSPSRLRAAEELLDGRRLTAETIRDAAQAASQEVQSFGDQHASAEYRREMTGVLLRRALVHLAGPESAGA